MHGNDRLRRLPRVEDLEGRRLLTATVHLTLDTFDGHQVHLPVTSAQQHGGELTVKLPASGANASAVQEGDNFEVIDLGKKAYYEVVAKSISVTGHGKSTREVISFSYFTTNPNKLPH